ncbi:MAG: cytochrome c [Chitinophagales bacterium]|nr:cytochrome c [Chitinophagales bacterium]
MRSIKNIVIVVLSTFMLSSCVSDEKKPGRVFMPDMHYSNAYETYSTVKNPLLWEMGDSLTWRYPANKTIPRGAVPMDASIRANESYLMSYTMINHMELTKEKMEANYEYAGANFENPVPLTEEMLKRAKVNYDRFCTVCHGTQGAGDGSIVVLPDGSDGPYTAIPPSYESRLPTISDGKIFFSISQGKGMMGGYGPQLTVQERWELVHYIKDMTNMYSEEDFVKEEEIIEETMATDASHDEEDHSHEDGADHSH